MSLSLTRLLWIYAETKMSCGESKMPPSRARPNALVPKSDVAWSNAAGSVGAGSAVFFSSRRRHTRFDCDWSSDVCSSDLKGLVSVRSLAWLRARSSPHAPQAAAATSGAIALEVNENKELSGPPEAVTAAAQARCPRARWRVGARLHGVAKSLPAARRSPARCAPRALAADLTDRRERLRVGCRGARSVWRSLCSERCTTI